MLSERGLRPKKHLGQNFLMDGNIAERIAALAVGNDQVPVMEVGAGTGALTQALVKRSNQVTALEIDPDMLQILRENEALRGARILEADALVFDFDAYSKGKDWVAAGNLPYNVGTPLLMRWVEAPQPPLRIVVMLQRDVADRLHAKPGSSAYGSLSVTTQLTMEVERAFTLGPSVFFPQPKVDSAVVVLRRRPIPIVDPKFLAVTREVARASFAYRRKTLINSLMLARGLSRTTLQDALSALGLDWEIRGEALDLAAFIALAQRLGT